MKQIGLIFLTWMVSTAAVAEVYKCVDENGKTSFSGAPIAGCQKVTSVPITTYTSPYASSGDEFTKKVAAVEESSTDSYRSFAISTPKDGATFYLNSGQLKVGVLTRPKLRRGHLLEYIVSRTQPSRKTRSRSVVINGVAVGDHTVTAKVYNRKGKLVGETAPISIHIQHSTVVANEDTRDQDADGNFLVDGGQDTFNEGADTTTRLQDDEINPLGQVTDDLGQDTSNVGQITTGSNAVVPPQRSIQGQTSFFGQ